MGRFLCDKCGCIENTALGFCWLADAEDNDYWEDKNLNGLYLCSACMPSKYSDGSNNARGGKWHGLFERKTPEELGLTEDKYYHH